MKFSAPFIKTALFLAIAFGLFQVVSVLVHPVELEHFDWQLGRKNLKQIPAALVSRAESENIDEQVNLAWDRIEAQLKKIAPRDLDSLNPGASEESIRKVESVLGYQLMADYRASLLRHNGTSSACIVSNFLSIEEFLKTRVEGALFNLELESLDDHDFHHKKGLWQPGVLTIGDSWFDMILDCESGETLTQSSVSYSIEHHDSFLHFLEQTADRLEGGWGYSTSGKNGNQTIWLDDFGG